jgi:hypothetical protein
MQDADGVLHVGRSPYTDPFLISTLLSINLPRFLRIEIRLHAFTIHSSSVQVEWILLTRNECASPFGCLRGIASKSTFEQRRGDEQRSDTEGEQEEQIVLDSHETAVFQQDRFEAMDAIGEGIDDGEGL